MNGQVKSHYLDVITLARPQLPKLWGFAVSRQRVGTENGLKLSTGILESSYQLYQLLEFGVDEQRI